MTMRERWDDCVLEMEHELSNIADRAREGNISDTHTHLMRLKFLQRKALDILDNLANEAAAQAAD